MDDGSWIALVPFVGLAVWGIVELVSGRRRRARWREIASRLGLQFEAKDPFDTPSRQRKQFFREGHSQRAYNVMYGDYKGVRVRCFDYRMTEGDGRTSGTSFFTCLLVATPVRFYPLGIRPETAGDRVNRLLGVHDLQFESAEFNRQFAVHCTNERFAYDVIHPRMMELLLRHKHREIEAYGWSVLICDPEGQARISDLEGEVVRLLEYGIEFVGLLPRYLAAESK
ncbi:MAG: hypothetical protein ABFE07_01965 [Armatimonadia bacterium]